MVACANASYKYEDLYALLERLKSQPNANQFFTATNNRREVHQFIRQLVLATTT